MTDKINIYKELEDVSKFLKDEKYRNAGNNCGYVLETLLAAIYEKVRLKASSNEVIELMKVEGSIGKGRAYTSFQLGEIVGLFREAKIFDIVQKLSQRDLKYTKKMPFDIFNEIRINCSHTNKPIPSYKEIEYFYNNLDILIDEVGDFIELEPRVKTLVSNENNTEMNDENNKKVEASSASEVDVIELYDSELIKEDEEAWKQAYDGNSLDSYQNYLNGDTAGRYEEEAEKRIGEINERIRLDNDAWELALSENTIRSYKKYLISASIEGFHKAEANEKIARIIDDAVWDTAMKSDTVVAYSEYLDEGYTAHKDEAKKAIKEIKLQESESVEKRRRDNEAWEYALSENTVSAYKKYLTIGSIDMLHKTEADEKITTINDNTLWEVTRKANTITAYTKYVNGGFKLHWDEANNAIFAIKSTEKEIAEKGEIDKKELEKKEELLWSKAESQNTLEAYRSYLNGSKTNKYKDKADRAIKNLENRHKLEDLESWNKVCKINTVEAYTNYLKEAKYKAHESQALSKMHLLIQEKEKAEEDKEQIISLLDGNNKIIEFKYIDSIKRGGVTYVLLSPRETGNNGEMEVVIFRCTEIKVTNSRPKVNYTQIQDQILLEALFGEFKERLK